ncbi:MAG: thermonuclease family protein [archaeon]
MQVKSLMLLSFLLVFILYFIFSSFILPSKSEKIEDAYVLKVIDGDTIKVLIRNKMESVRFVGINAPETNECYWKEAKEYVESRLSMKKVKLVYDSHSKIDRYGRILAYVYVDGVDFGRELLEKGYVRVFEKYPFDKMKEYIELQEKSAQEKKGLWSAC